VTAKSLLLAGVAMLALAGAGCSASSTPAPQPPTPINATITDPTGDTNSTATGTTIYDITGVTTSRTGPPGGTYTTITVTATFVQPVLLPAAGALPDGAGTQLAFILAFDIDGNFADGTNYALCGSGGGGTYNGADYIVDANGITGARLADGNYPIKIEPAGTQTGEATVSVAGNTITWTVPISAIGNNPAGPFNFGMIAGNGPSPSDCAANSGYTTANFLVHPMSGIPQAKTQTGWVR
jgi:hypothetical protein